MGAGLIDVALLLLLDAVVIILTLRLTGLDMRSFRMLPSAPLAAFLVLMDGGYLVVLTGAGGQTFGDMVFGIRVTDLSRRPVTMSVAFARAVGLVLAVVPLGAGVLWMCVDPHRRGLHDRLAGTRVQQV